MEIIVLILIIALTLASSTKKKKQQQSRSAKAPSLPVQKASAAARAVVERAMAEMERGATPAQRQQAEESEAALRRARERARRRLQDAKLSDAPVYPQGGSAVDAEGCVGGSLPHDHAEGESREEHARHIAAMEARDRAEAPQEARKTDARQLRRAVVMAEILDRPRALRARRGA